MSDQEQADFVRSRASRAFGWSFGNTLAGRLGTLLIGITLARVLGPEEFGIFAIATVALLAVLSFNELGVSLAVIRWREDPALTAPTINTIAVTSSALLTGAMIVAAPWISAGLGDPAATPVVQVIALSVLINGLVATPAAILQREFLQRQRTIADQVNTWLGAGLSLLLALLGWGAMSLAIGRLVASLVFAVMIWRWSPVPYRFGWDRAVVGRLLRFGLPLAASSIVVFASGYVDQIIVGSMLGAQALGFYVLAFNLASWPVSIFSLPLRAVAPAAFSALKHDPPRMSRNFFRVLTVLSCVALPTCLAISGAADAVVGFVYGSPWLPAGEILMWMAAVAALRIWFELAYDYLVVQGRSAVVLLIQTCSFAVSLPVTLAVVGPYGQSGVAAVQLFVAVVVVLPLYVWNLVRVQLPARSLLAAVALPVAAGVLVWCACWAVTAWIDAAFVASLVSAAIAAAAIGLLAFWQRGNLRLLRQAFAGKGQS
ncbi:oligosaccharide flippase family protein [Microbacterium sp. NPDC058021]|uniref:oligosaccharide flippase family protein n=1 Tax=Microbacterium sp. NPDC058021 TaxID=3346306 RepID=UPI0036D7C751